MVRIIARREACNLMWAPNHVGACYSPHAVSFELFLAEKQKNPCWISSGMNVCYTEIAHNALI